MTLTQYYALGIFLLTYILLAFQGIPGIFLPRPAATLAGAVAMVAAGVVALNDAYRLVDLNTIVFLLGMMIIVAYLQVSGFFQIVERRILSRAKTRKQFLGWLIASSGILSALFMNDAVCVMLTPVVLLFCERASLRPAPYLIALATSSNIGSAFTPMGNPQNMLIAVHSGIPFTRFVLALAPCALGGLALNYLFISRLYRNELSLPLRQEPLPPEDRPRSRLIYVCLGATALLLVMLAVNMSPAFAAISVATLLIVAGSTRPREALKEIDWQLLLMFAGLFVVMGGLREAGLMEKLTAAASGAAARWPEGKLWLLGGISTVLSNLASNVPAVMLLSNTVDALGGGTSLWLCLAVTSTVAGNLTIIGSVANLIVFETAREKVKIGFMEYFYAGAPVGIFLIIVSCLWVGMIKP